MKVPFANLTSQYRNLKPEIDQAIDSVLDSGNFIGGEPIRLFEKNFADVCSVKHCIGLGNGTAGLFLALKALDVGPGDEVITPAWSWISTSEVITLAGAKPVFADVDPAFMFADISTPDSVFATPSRTTESGNPIATSNIC